MPSIKSPIHQRSGVISYNTHGNPGRSKNNNISSKPIRYGTSKLIYGKRYR